MFKKIIYTICILYSTIGFAQVGINTTDPKALFDVEASNRTTPANTDGLLVPRVDVFPATNPGVDQQGMLLYLTTTSGANSPGIYMWNNSTSSWVNINKAVTNLLEDADTDTKIQVEESPDEDVIRLDLGGIQRFIFEGPRLKMTNSGQSVFIGNNAGLNDDLVSNRNVFVGDFTGSETISGQSNLALGFSALRNNITGNNNIALGANALGNSVPGDDNVAIGFRAGRNNSGDNSVFLGALSGLNSTGSNNVFLGASSGNFETNSNRLYIENTGSTSPLIYGEFDNDIVRVNGELQIGNAFIFPIVDG